MKKPTLTSRGRSRARAAASLTKQSSTPPTLKRPPRKTSFQRGKEANGTNKSEQVATREKILDAAKLHFAEFGLAHASVRAITKMAGVNSALIRYYFGSKKALYEEVIHKITQRLVATRLGLLNRLRDEYEARAIPIDKLVRSYAEPLFPRAIDDLSQDAAIYLRFFGRLYTEPSDELREIIQPPFTDLQTRYIEEIKRSTPLVSNDTIAFRFGLLIGALAFLVSKVGVISVLSRRRIDESDSQLTLAQLANSYDALFRAPDVRGG